MTEKIYILLPVHNRVAITQAFIQCLRAQTYDNFHLILIDDGSRDGTADMVRKEIPASTVLTGTGNWWWAGSLQQGYGWLKKQNVQSTDLVMIINDDTEIKPDFLASAVTLLRGRERTLLAAQAFYLKSGDLNDAGVHASWKRLTFPQAAKPEEINCLSTRGLFLRVSDFFEIGGFYPRLLPHYLSDYEFTIRAFRKGMKLMTDPGLKIWVNEDTTGYCESRHNSLRRNIAQVFSKKSMTNPIAWTFFIALACPWYWKPTCWIICWKRALAQIIRGAGDPTAAAKVRI